MVICVRDHKCEVLDGSITDPKQVLLKARRRAHCGALPGGALLGALGSIVRLPEKRPQW
jgi:hypothetical protein